MMALLRTALSNRLTRINKYMRAVVFRTNIPSLSQRQYSALLPLNAAAAQKIFPQPSLIARYRYYSETTLSALQYDQVSEDTLESLAEYFDGLSELCDLGADYDVNYSQGVLTVKFGGARGTYVINKQSPNKQIWLSSPTSGPKRYDFVNDVWFYSREGRTLHQLLNDEISKMLGVEVDFTNCSFGCK